jgi:hypothetical protein
MELEYQKKIKKLFQTFQQADGLIESMGHWIGNIHFLRIS